MANAQNIILHLKALGDFSDVTGDISQIQQMLNKIKLPSALKKNFEGIFDDLTVETQKYQRLLDSGFKKKGDVTGLEASSGRINGLLKRLRGEMDKISDADLQKSFQIDPSKIQELSNKAKELRTNLQSAMATDSMTKFKTQAGEAAAKISEISKTKFTSNFTEAFNKGDIQGATEALKQLETNHKAFQDSAKEQTFQQALKDMKTALNGLSGNTELQNLNQQIRDVDLQMDQLDADELQAFINAFTQGKGSVESFRQSVRGLTGQYQQAATAAQQHASQLDQFKNQVMYFFSLTNGVQLFKRAVTKALNTVKELDKTMTEAAVVTEFDVSDMWDKLPQYAKHAQELGVSINGMYQATTLYYQQGLKTNEAMALGIETMKMGKIAAMDSTEATKAMTAALRGFNMELNEISATRVNDVYSQLAAVTAADTNQIATAMEKTASIAAAANMEFESTAAFLAQIIETTQEAPETAGTALKTIIARFSEVKSLRDQGLSSGKDEEGEGIDVNKIQTALKTVGISMEGFFAGTEGLDSILLKLAEKWSGLDFETQRYIATMAAGSRQQSRFIAMMSDYARTSELVGEAQNSAGASARQFEKTLESMESKLQRLDNAWNEFLMGLANNEILKGAVDLVTSLVTGINNLTNGLSGGNGVLKSFVSLMVTLGGLSMGKAALSGGLGWIGRQMGIKGVEPQVEKLGFSGRAAQWSQQKGGRKVLGFVSNKEATERAQDRAKNFGTNKAIKENKKILKSSSNKEDFSQKLKESTTDTEKNNAAMAAANKTYEDAINNQKGVKVAAEEATKEFERQGGTLINAKQEQEILSNSTKKLGVDYKALGGAVMGAGAAFGGLAVLLSAAGFDEAAESMGKISGALMGLGAVISFLGPVVQGFAAKIAAAGVTAGVAWAWAIGLAVVIGAIVAAIFILGANSKSAAEEIEELNSQMDGLADAADKAEESMQRLADTQKDLVNLKSTMDGLIKGTDEWNKALIDSNNKVLELLDTYPELAEYITPNQDGLLEVGAEGWTMITKKQMNAYTNASAAKWALSAKKTTVSGRMIDENDDMTLTEKDARKKALGIQGDIQVEEFYRQVVVANSGLKRNEFSEYSAMALAAEGLDNFVQMLDKTAAALELNEQAYQEYADMMDITLEEAKDADKNAVKNTLAASRIQKQSASRMKTMNTKIADMLPKEQEYIKALLSKDGSKITSGQGKYLEENLNSFKEKLELTNAEFEGLKTTLKQINSTFENLEATIETLGLQGTNLGKYLQESNYQVVSGITSKIADLESSGVNSATIISWFGELLADKTKEERDSIFETLAVTNWHSLEDLSSTFDSLVEQGLLDPKIAEGLESTMKELAGAVSDNTVAYNQQKGFQLKDIMDQILSGELTNVMTTEQKNTLVRSGAFTEDEFQQTGTDQWVFSGDMYSRVINLYGEIKDNTERSVVSASKEVERSEGIQGIMGSQATGTSKGTQVKAISVDTGFQNIEDIGNWLNLHQTGWTTFDEWMSGHGVTKEMLDTNPQQKKEIEKGYLSYINDLYKNYFYNFKPTEELPTAGIFETTGTETYEKVIKGLQSGLTYSDDTVDEIGSAIADILGEDFIEGTNEEKTQWILDKYDKYVTKADQLKTDAAIDTINEAKGVGSFVGTTAEYGYAGGQLKAYHQDDYAENYEKGIETRYILYGGTAFMDQLTKGMSQEEIKKYDTLLKALASDLGYTAQKTKTFAENMSNLSENLTESKRGTYEYGQALESAYTNIDALFSQDSGWAKSLNLSQELLEGLTKGDKGAFEELQKIIQQNVKEAFESGSDEGMKALSNAGLTFDMIGNLKVGTYLDGQQLNATTQAVLDSIQATGKEGERAFAWMMQAQGLAVAYQYGEDGEVTGFSLAQSGQANLFSQHSGGGSGGGGSKYENSHDKLYNTYEKINALLREREKIERRYDQLLQKRASTLNELKDTTRQQLDVLAEEQKLQKYARDEKLKQIDDLMAENSKYSDYITSFDKQTGVISINWEEFNKLTDSEKGEKVDKYLSELEGFRDQWRDAQDAIEDIEDAVQEIAERGKDEYLDIENQIKDAIIDSRQKQIDKLSDINDSINDANSKLLESMQEQIDQYRQARDNEKTEKELSDKQRRLAYLSQDTSGANALEILQLQKEIEEGQESYTDQLIDQKISELQKQNDKAAEQRQHQIELQQAILDQDVESGKIWNQVGELISKGLNEDGSIKPDSELMDVLKEGASYKSMSEIGQMDWLRGIETTLKNGLAWKEGSGALASFWKDEEITFRTADGIDVTGTVQADGTVVDSEGNVYKEVSWEGGNVFKTKESVQKKAEEDNEETEGTTKPSTQPNGYYKEVWRVGNREYKTEAEAKATIDRIAEDKIRELDQDYANMTPSEIQIYEEAHGPYWSQVESILSNTEKEKNSLKSTWKWVSYKTGGLADFTGPAWLDGTKSRPEYILNADQTKAFFTLVDVLSGLTNSSQKTTEKTGDNTYDIDINVESIGSNYDVEQLAETVKRLINEDARYRNNNAINLMR